MVVDAKRLNRQGTIPMVDLRSSIDVARDTIDRNLEAMLESSQFILGPQTEAFEREFAQAVGGVVSVGVGSGTAALELCLRDAGVGTWTAAGATCDVIVPAMTSMFTALAVVAAGARVRIADVSPGNLLLTPESIEAAWTPETRAVIAVHLYGQPCDLPEIAHLCESRGAILIQDACQAHGAAYRGLPLTHFSPYVAYSFYPTKNLGCLGDGGAVVTSHAEVAARLRQMRDGGRRGDQLCRAPGINSRLDEMQSCYLRAFLPYLPEWNAQRKRVAVRYAEVLKGAGDLQLIDWDDDAVHHLCVARTERRDDLRAFLASHGVQSGVHYPVAIHEQPGLLPFASWREEPKVAARAAREVISLPIGPHVSETAAEQIALLARSMT